MKIILQILISVSYNMTNFINTILKLLCKVGECLK